MLKRVTCDKFKTQPSEFHKGLNVVLGSSGGSNAIGKSTFLLILDFVLGGDDYIKSAKDVFERSVTIRLILSLNLMVSHYTSGVQRIVRI